MSEPISREALMQTIENLTVSNRELEQRLEFVKEANQDLCNAIDEKNKTIKRLKRELEKKHAI